MIRGATELVIYLGYRVAEFIARILPRRWSYRLGGLLADYCYRRDAVGRAGVVANLRRILRFQGRPLTDAEIELEARQTFRYFAKYLVDFFYFTTRVGRPGENLVVFENMEYFRQAQSVGRGVLLVTAHLGNWELGAGVMAEMGYTMNAIALAHSDERLDRFFIRSRKRRGVHVIPVGSAVRSVCAALARNELVGLLADRDYTRRNDPILFFGERARLPRGPVWLAVRTGAPIVPAFLLRQPDDTYVMRFHAPLIPGVERDMVEMQRRLCTALETEISRNPFQWFMFRDVWDENSYAGESGRRIT